jgi:plasmid stabilization system protein ParE
MKRDVRLSWLANRDLIRLNDFLELKSPSAARKASQAISTGLRSLADSAQRGRVVGDGIRELRIRFGRDGYVARYRVEANFVTVTRIFHARERRR